MLKKFLNNLFQKILVATMCMTIMVANSIFATSTDQAASVANGMFDAIWSVVCAIPALLAVMSGINAGIAYSQAHADGGNAAASGKFSSQIVACLLCAIITLLCATTLKDLVSGLFK